MESWARESGGKETTSVNVEGSCDACGFQQTLTGDATSYTVHALAILTNWAYSSALKTSYDSGKSKVDVAHKQHDPSCRRIPKYTWVK